MGLYIKDMEMPKEGNWITLRVFPDGQCFLYSWCGNDFDFMEHLTAIPAADVRPVVLCRECFHSTPWYSDKSRCFLWHEDGIDVFNDGFCNYGEKREES